MKIVVNEIKKQLELYKKDGTMIDSYPYKSSIDENFTVEDLKADIESFNITLGQQEEFDKLKDMANIVKIHNWD